MIVCLHRSTSRQMSAASIDQDAPGLSAELSIQKPMADGMVLRPGLVYTHYAGRGTVELCCRSSWTF